jgi:hypothetical protein
MASVTRVDVGGSSPRPHRAPGPDAAGLTRSLAALDRRLAAIEGTLDGLRDDLAGLRREVRMAGRVLVAILVTLIVAAVAIAGQVWLAWPATGPA